MTNQAQNTKPELVYSLNDEEWCSDTLSDLITDNDLCAGDIIYIGYKKHPSHSRFFQADEVIDNAGDRACDEFGEFADDYPDATQQAEEELQALLDAWAEKHLKITFYNAVDTSTYTITDQDIAEAYIHAE